MLDPDFVKKDRHRESITDLVIKKTQANYWKEKTNNDYL
jgi:hypothetical protein